MAAVKIWLSSLQLDTHMVLYIWTIPLGISDLAAGIIWLAIFEQSGFLNSMLAGVGIIDQPINLLSYQHMTTVFTGCST